jgi:predicted nucleic acid-binding protein
VAGNDSVLVDSSVWIDFFRGNPIASNAIRSLSKTRQVVICGQIKQEVLQGSRDSKAFAQLETQMSIWRYEPETPGDFIEAARIFSALRWKGITIPPSNCLIAAVAIRLKVSICTYDPDFDAIPHLEVHKL